MRIVFVIKRVVFGFVAASLLGLAVVAAGCGGDADEVSERAVEWVVDRPLGPKQVRLLATVESCLNTPPGLEKPRIKYSDSRAYIELRKEPEEPAEDAEGCFLSLFSVYKRVTLERGLDELVLFDSSTDPPEQRWPRK